MSRIAAVTLGSKKDPGARAEDGAARFDYLLPADKQWFRLVEIAKIIERSESFVEKLFEEGRLLSGHSYSTGASQRCTKRVPRCFVISMLVKTAEYTDEIKLQAFLSCLHEFSPERLRQIATAANCLCQQKSRQGSAAAAGKTTGTG